MVSELTQSGFKEFVSSDIPVLVDFWASWCGPCRMVSPLIDQLAKDYDGKIKVGKVNVDDETALASQFSVISIPTVILFKNGEEIKKLIGVQSMDDYADMIEESL